MPAPLRILIAVDGSAAANRAVQHALSLFAGRRNVEIVLLNVQNLHTLDISDISGVISVEADRKLAGRQSMAALRKAAALCGKAAVKFEQRAEIGDPAEAINRVAHESGADQIFMGTRGLSAFGNLLLGSVAAKVIHHGRVPVTLVK